jgi:hypothetical protein
MAERIPFEPVWVIPTKGKQTEIKRAVISQKGITALSF